jgi:diaminopimelate epimerase
MKKARIKQGILFWKVQGAGNDALIVESRDFPARKAAFVRNISHRSLGVGADQLLEVISRGPVPEIQIWNGDGSRPEMCANGTRSFLQFALDKGWIKKQREISVVVSGKAHQAFFDGKIALSLGFPHVSTENHLKVLGKRFAYTPVSTGNPHAVIFPSQKLPRDFDYKVYGPLIECHKNFPKKTNVEFIRGIKIRGGVVTMQVEAWERGAGATLSCGSGAVAAAAAHREHMGNIFHTYRIQMTKFTLTVRFKNNEAFLSGPSSTLAEGRFFPKI